MQIKFVAVSMTILIGVFLLMLGSINIIMQTVSQSQSLRLLVQIAESDRYNAPDMTDPKPPDPLTESRSVRTAAAWGEPEDWRYGEEWGNWHPPQPPMDPPPEWETWGEFVPPEPWQEPTPPEPWQDPQPTQPPDTQPPQTETQAPAPTEQVQGPAPGTLPLESAAPSDPPTDMPSEPFPASETMEPVETETPALPPTEPSPPPHGGQPDKWNLTITLDHFAILAGKNGEFIDLRNTEDYTLEQAEEILAAILSSGESAGMYGWLQYCAVEKEYGTLLVITDKSSDQGLLNNLFRTTVMVGVLMLLVLLVFLCFLARWIVKPVENAFARQKQFVSDAGHELKTPLTILSANADILQDEIGENKWLGYMQEQTSRMNQLVGDLLHLARMDNASQEYVLAPFNLSTAVTATVLPFESQAFELHKHLEMDIEPGLTYKGSEQHIRQLAAIFVDNALKYSNENGTIKISLIQRGDNRILEFYNTGCGISPEETGKIFERFYRGDRARENHGTSGYGLGLAIAKSIMDMHKIRIQVTCEKGGWIRFLLTL